MTCLFREWIPRLPDRKTRVRSSLRTPLLFLAFLLMGSFETTGDDLSVVVAWASERNELPACVGVVTQPQSRSIVTIGRDGLLRTWEPETGRRLDEIDVGRSDACAIAADPVGLVVAIARDDSPDIELWDTGTGRLSSRLTGGPVAADSVAFSPDGASLAGAFSAVSGARIMIWETDSGRLLRTWEDPRRAQLKGANHAITAVAYSPAAGLLASVSRFWITDGWADVVLWDPRSGEIRGRVERLEAVEGISFSPDGETVAGGGRNIRLWDVRTTQLRDVLPAVGEIAFHPEGRLVAVYGRSRIEVIELRGRRGLATVAMDDDVVGVVFSPGGERLIAAGESRHLVTWELHWRTPAGAVAAEKESRGRLSAAELDGYRRPDLHRLVREVPADVERQLAKEGAPALPLLVSHVQTVSEDPFVQIRLIHDWIASNIAYDHDADETGTSEAALVREALRSQRAGSRGYSALLRAACSEADFRCESIHGYVRDYRFDPFAGQLSAGPEHWWNVVRVGEYWYLVDAALDSPGAGPGPDRSIPSTEYFLIAPEYMIHTHLPEDAEWQLLDRPRSKTQFENLPVLTGRYFERGFGTFRGLRAVNRRGSVTEFTVPGGREQILSAGLWEHEGEPWRNRVLVVPAEEGHRVHVTFPQAGDWVVGLYAKSPGDEKSLWVANIAFSAREGTDRVFPTVYRSYGEQRCALLEPLWGPLRVGQKVRIALRIPNAFAATLAGGTSLWEGLSLGDEEWAFPLTVPPCEEIVVFAQLRDGPEGGSAILQFPVTANDP